MPFEEQVILKGASNMISHIFLDNTSQQNPIDLVCCCWQLVLDKDTKHTEKGVSTCSRIFCNSFIV